MIVAVVIFDTDLFSYGQINHYYVGKYIDLRKISFQLSITNFSFIDFIYITLY